MIQSSIPWATTQKAETGSSGQSNQTAGNVILEASGIQPNKRRGHWRSANNSPALSVSSARVESQLLCIQTPVVSFPQEIHHRTNPIGRTPAFAR